MRADWILPEDKKLEVTLKILNSEKHLAVCESLGLSVIDICKNIQHILFQRL